MCPTVLLLAVSLPLRALPCAQNQPQIANAGPNKIAYAGRTRAIEQAPADPASWHESLGVVGFEAYGPGEIVIARPTMVFTQAVFCTPCRNSTSVAVLKTHPLRGKPI